MSGHIDAAWAHRWLTGRSVGGPTGIGPGDQGKDAHLDIADGKCAMQHAKGEEGAKVLRHEDGVEAHHRNAGCTIQRNMVTLVGESCT